MKVSNSKLHQHFKLYKPYGYLSQFQSNARHQKNSKFLRDLYDFPVGVMAIGRLDQDSEGLLLVTTDGQRSNEMNSSAIEKEYYAQVDGIVTENALKNISKGITISINGALYTTSPCKAIVIETPQLPDRGKHIRDSRHGATSWLSITITEGKFRQVRKMTAAAGFPTLRLVRVRVGSIHLNGMQPSDVLEITSFADDMP